MDRHRRLARKKRFMNSQTIHDILIFASYTSLVAAGAIALGWAIVAIARRLDR